MLILKTVPLLNVKESPDKIFFGQSLHTNLPKLGMIHTDYENRYINQGTQGSTPNTRNFGVNDPVWIKLNDDLPWKCGIIEKVHDHQSYTVQVDGKKYRRNTHYLTRRYPRDGANRDSANTEGDDDFSDTPQKTQKNLRPRQKVKMPRIPLQATVYQDFSFK